MLFRDRHRQHNQLRRDGHDAKRVGIIVSKSGDGGGGIGQRQPATALLACDGSNRLDCCNASNKYAIASSSVGNAYKPCGAGFVDVAFDDGARITEVDSHRQRRSSMTSSETSLPVTGTGLKARAGV